MSEQNVGTESKGEKYVRKMYATKAECDAAMATHPAKNAKAFEVFVDAKSKGWVIAVNADLAVCYAARLHGWTATQGRAPTSISPEAAKNVLASLSPEVRKALGIVLVGEDQPAVQESRGQSKPAKSGSGK